jgi:sulfite exporter TauE/SafE
VSGLELAAAAVAGLAASAHCLAMCGPVTCALDGARPSGPRAGVHGGFQLGRVTGYAIAGLAAGSLGGALRTVAPSDTQWTVRAVAALLGVLVGLQSAGVLRPFSALEPVARRALGPVLARAKAWLRGPSSGEALVLGLLWSLVPCGMVYGALALAAAAGSARGGALTMLAFGLGTTPALLALAWVSGRIRGAMAARWVAPARIALGLCVALASLTECVRALDRGGWFGEGVRVVWDPSDHCAPRRP